MTFPIPKRRLEKKKNKKKSEDWKTKSVSLVEKSLMESVSDKARISESAQEKVWETDGQDMKPDVSIEESRNEEDDTDVSTAAESQSVSSSFYRRGGGPKRKKGDNKKRIQQEKSKEKLKVLVETLKPVSFAPCKTLDFSRHEKLLKAIGLWDFLHLEFDQCIRHDLVACLIACYSPESRCSYVNGSRIKLSRPDLARALKLPAKKDLLVISDEEKELVESDESIRFIEDIVSTWFLLHDDDAWMMPTEVVEWTKGIKEKQWDKLDWAGLLWFMLEKELKAELPLEDCFYASHMQMVIRSQKEDLLKEQPKVEDDDAKGEDVLVKSPKKEQSRAEDDDAKGEDVLVKSPREEQSRAEDDDDVKEMDLEERYVEEHMIQLNLGQEIVSEMVTKEEEHHEEQQPMDPQESKKEEDEKWPWNEDSHAGQHFLTRCDIGVATEGDEGDKLGGHREQGEDESFEDVAEEETEEDRENHDGRFPLFPNGDNLMLGDTSPLGYSSGLQFHGKSTTDFLADRVDMHMVSSSSYYGRGKKRQIDHENDIVYPSHSHGTKRLNTEVPSWDENPAPFEICMEQIKQWVDKAKLSYADKERACGEAEMSQHLLLNELQRRDEVIQQLEKSKYEEQQRKDLEIYKLENELRMMTSVLAWYKKSLKEAQKGVKEHRKCDEVYKDVIGSGGLVLSTTEIEKRRLKEEEEERMRRVLIKRHVEESGNLMIKEYEVKFNSKMELLEEKLIGVKDNLRIMKETVSKREVVDTPERSDAATDT